ncbi:MAG TPA: hypothetical protein VKA46_20220 [Gemmataceae bacterium]|nr:hypothetical protein [Gemmataceae bacterium]
MTTQASRSPLAALVCGVAIPAALWAAVFAGLLMVVPRYQKRYQEFGLSLPYNTQVAMEVAAWANTYWYVLLLWLVIFLPSGTAIAVALGRRPTRGLSRLWSGVMIALPLLAAALLVFAIYLAQAKLHAALSG